MPPNTTPLPAGEDHYTQGSGSQHGIPGTVDLWGGHELSNETGIYSGYLYATKAVKVIEDFAAGMKKAKEQAAGQQATKQATKQAQAQVQAPAYTGLFLYLAWHNTHTPLECPSEYMYPAHYNNTFKPRMVYNCMTHILDDG